MKQSKWFFFMLVAWLLMGAEPIFAQNLSLESVLQSLDQHYPPLQAARQKLEMAKGKRLQKQGAFDTKLKAKGSAIPLGYYEQIVLDSQVEQALPLWGLSLFGGYRLGAGNIAPYDGKKQTDGLGEIRTGFRLPLLRDGVIDQVRLEIAQADLELELARLDVFEKQLKFVKEASKYYWSWVAAAHKTRLAEDLLHLAEKRNQDILKSIQLGQLPRIAQIENQTSIFKRQAKLIETRQKQQTMAWELSLYLRKQTASVFTGAQAFADFPPVQNRAADQLLKPLTQALARRPEPLGYLVQLEQNRLSRVWAENQKQPQLDLNFAISKDLGGSDKTRDPLELEAGLGLEWPVQNRKATGLLQELVAKQKQLELEYGFWHEKIAVELQSVVTALVAAQQRVNLARQQVQVAQELELAEQERFALGATTLLVLNLREQSRGDAVNEQIEALESWFKAWAEYLAALGLVQESVLGLP
ncbi:hypothetical protein COW36_00930 [bacterium (Candidatus Blackallbacteria) CG17_big_fil_post_rev_8_21_14_2_50_48_46]|uniref:TolC family protein n=1 Tax=bacterium (Candidatus Blackallbacteria) CG17_big_fil_post_rev_8_21_14_2_50_48_46 TaxID=2014261 RepID=A0A2M7GB75_9BACT|nr:MAG: hypothetical protein COW64_10245 [bacterium (Candidatus Blackallbacteria) CG18_big_fil_WC_8_21_14_2_50_49_26]PIW19432.1 MAG: hypothetical protein COW36_00930 [bacterium (Candidatus Blackallbacteria) CG17_big_fil_post_rev_8_21_14_2_50_48_46]PIW48964.1 MAG: hypothetical protein COW20_07525 [bacterium (Candidatus Blackallbacteria) CG13_big_fil_rev_8_21_14_2_50_49_14]